jgi:hypothetical protein
MNTEEGSRERRQTLNGSLDSEHLSEGVFRTGFDCVKKGEKDLSGNALRCRERTQ